MEQALLFSAEGNVNWCKLFGKYGNMVVEEERDESFKKRQLIQHLLSVYFVSGTVLGAKI